MEIHVKRPSRKQNTNEYQALTENALCARHFYEHFTYINSFNPYNLITPNYAWDTDEQRGRVISPRSHSR